MAISLDDLLAIEPSKVSRDLSGYITYIYGQPKVGKTTLAKDMGALILSCEDGTRAMSGAYSVIIKSWGDIKSIARACKDPKFKERYRALAVDTLDLAGGLCEKYICQQNDIESLSKLPYGQGWTFFKKEFEEVFRSISLEGLAILFIGHDKVKTITRQDGTEYNKIVPTASESINNVAKNMADIFGYAYQEPNSDERYVVLRSTGEIEAGTRFPHIASKIPFNYNSLIKALNEAIDAEEKINGKDAVCDDRKGLSSMEAPTYDFEALTNEFETIVGELMNKNQAYYSPRVVSIVDHYLGKGKKVSDATIEQVELIDLIVSEIKETLVDKK